ncbi:hypothetical protein DN824_14455 [Stutzerimonas nosocomialis]|uniref:Copper-binding protein n=1 Tax=Stutzerimonas nosocomialis TaxID=1056496 RepID=A0A5R9R031_9GAMM|nr:copper-binding protein [Stutzerimonas nosocomialis]TLX56759.1 hypothetical protein DN824_14455 [Stutzerimonas nosocomialis]TLX58472.1 hypothetical protein DN826_04015 [Stutzerimonas nosocomialis]TLX64215.1 hypothetical protein DN820_05980 [Stutzerimonas nosocomialis]
MKPLVAASLVLLCFNLPSHAQDLLKPTDQQPLVENVSDQALEADTAVTAEGEITAIDAARERVTIAHGPVPSLKWPENRTAFRARPEQLHDLKVGDRVAFSFQADGSGAALVAIEKR